MCGLFGFVSFRSCFNERLPKATRALHAVKHRGPDQFAECIVDNVFLGHRRLSILDLSEAGRQPMSSLDGAIAITVNGEIYNYPQLRQELGAEQFRSGSDSEVVLHAYRNWGIDGLLQRIDGMFAFAIHDRHRKKIVLVRDRVGIKPLYYASVGACFAWASELKALEYFLSEERLERDGTALYDFLTYRYVPCPKTPYKQIRKLPAAHSLILDTDSGDLSLSRYWTLDAHTKKRPQADVGEEIRERIGASVRAQLASDVPLGTFLSGGIDSTITTYHARAVRPHLHSFSIGFDESSHDETYYAGIASQAFSTCHHVKRLVRADSTDIITLMRSLFDEPFGDYSALPTWHVSKLARERVTVVLSGDGGDELFGGYPWYERIDRILRMRGPFAGIIERASLPYRKRTSSRMQSLGNMLALHAGMGIFELYVVLMNGVPRVTRQRFRSLLGVPADYDDYWHLRRYYYPALGLRKSLQILDFHTYLPDDILTKVDRASMHFGLECRVPLLAKDVVDLAFSLPEEHIYLGGRLKGGLRNAYQNLIPTEIVERPKKGFGIPVGPWGVLGEDESFELRVLRDYLDNGSSQVQQALLINN